MSKNVRSILSNYLTKDNLLIKLNLKLTRFPKDTAKILLTINMVFTSFKINTILANKDVIPNYMTSSLIWKFACVGFRSIIKLQN